MHIFLIFRMSQNQQNILVDDLEETIDMEDHAEENVNKINKVR